MKPYRTYVVVFLLTLSAVSLSNLIPAFAADDTEITVRAHRIYADYWDPCFAEVCDAGYGPGVGMYIELDDTWGNYVDSGFADENGYTFSGLDPNETYYVYATSCYDCNGNPHDVLFEYWEDNGSSDYPRETTTGTELDAWYDCTNGCGGDY